MEFRAVVAGVLALVFTSVRVALGSGSIPPTVRHPQLPHVCDSGPLRGCACSPTEDDPNGICSDAPFEEPFFEIGPQCLPVLLDGPRATATGIAIGS